MQGKENIENLPKQAQKVLEVSSSHNLSNQSTLTSPSEGKIIFTAEEQFFSTAYSRSLREEQEDSIEPTELLQLNETIVLLRSNMKSTFFNSTEEETKTINKDSIAPSDHTQTRKTSTSDSEAFNSLYQLTHIGKSISTDQIFQQKENYLETSSINIENDQEQFKSSLVALRPERIQSESQEAEYFQTQYQPPKLDEKEKLTTISESFITATELPQDISRSTISDDSTLESLHRSDTTLFSETVYNEFSFEKDIGNGIISIHVSLNNKDLICVLEEDEKEEINPCACGLNISTSFQGKLSDCIFCHPVKRTSIKQTQTHHHEICPDNCQLIDCPFITDQQPPFGFSKCMEEDMRNVPSANKQFSKDNYIRQSDKHYKHLSNSTTDGQDDEFTVANKIQNDKQKIKCFNENLILENKYKCSNVCGYDGCPSDFLEKRCVDPNVERKCNEEKLFIKTEPISIEEPPSKPASEQFKPKENGLVCHKNVSKGLARRNTNIEWKSMTHFIIISRGPP